MNRRASLYDRSPPQSPLKIKKGQLKATTFRLPIKLSPKRDYDFYQTEKALRYGQERDKGFCQQWNFNPMSSRVDDLLNRHKRNERSYKKQQTDLWDRSQLKSINVSCDCSECGTRSQFQRNTKAFPKQIRQIKKKYLKSKFRIAVQAIRLINLYRGIIRKNAQRFKKQNTLKILTSVKIKFFQHPKDFEQNLNAQLLDIVRTEEQKFSQNPHAASNLNINIEELRKQLNLDMKGSVKIIKNLLPKMRQPYAQLRNYVERKQQQIQQPLTPKQTVQKSRMESRITQHTRQNSQGDHFFIIRPNVSSIRTTRKGSVENISSGMRETISTLPSLTARGEKDRIMLETYIHVCHFKRTAR